MLPQSLIHSCAPIAAPCALFDTSWPSATPVWLISAFTRNTGIFAAMARLMLPIEPDALAGSRMIPATWVEIAVEIRLASVFTSPLLAATCAV